MRNLGVLALAVLAICLVALPLIGGCTEEVSLLINYQRSGGIAGLSDELNIYTDGHCELQRKDVEREFNIKSSEVAHLEELLEEANFLDLSEEYLLSNMGADLFQYVISYHPGEGRMHTVRTVDGAVPDVLQPILSELDQLISTNS